GAGAPGGGPGRGVGGRRVGAAGAGRLLRGARAGRAAEGRRAACGAASAGRPVDMRAAGRADAGDGGDEPDRGEVAPTRWSVNSLTRYFTDRRHRFFGPPSFGARRPRVPRPLEPRAVIALERKTWHGQGSGGRVPGGALTLLPVMSEAHGTARPGSRERGRGACGGGWRTCSGRREAPGVASP